jgi:hypothetical protein
MKREKLQQG